MPRFDLTEDRLIAALDEQLSQEHAAVRAPLAERLSLKSLLSVLKFYQLHHWEAPWLRG